MLQANIRRQVLRQKALEEVELLTQQHLITSSQELYDAITEIENNSSSASKIGSMKTSLLKTQINIRKF